MAGDGTEAGEVGVQGHPWICSEFEASQDYRKPYQNNDNRKVTPKPINQLYKQKPQTRILV